MSDVILIEGYAIVAENGEYLRMEQTGNNNIDVFTTEYPDGADVYNTYDKAQEIAKDVLKNDGKWDYWVHSNPVGVVKIEKTIKIGIVKGLK